MERERERELERSMCARRKCRIDRYMHATTIRRVDDVSHACSFTCSLGCMEFYNRYAWALCIREWLIRRRVPLPRRCSLYLSLSAWPCTFMGDWDATKALPTPPFSAKVHIRLYQRRKPRARVCVCVCVFVREFNVRRPMYKLVFFFL